MLRFKKHDKADKDKDAVSKRRDKDNDRDDSHRSSRHRSRSPRRRRSPSPASRRHRSRSPRRRSRSPRRHERRNDRSRSRSPRRRRSPKPSSSSSSKDKPKKPATGSKPVPQYNLIEVEVNDRLGKKARVKCSPKDTVGDFKKLVAAQIGTEPQKIILKKWYKEYKDHITLDDYEIHNGMNLELYYR